MFRLFENLYAIVKWLTLNAGMRFVKVIVGIPFMLGFTTFLHMVFGNIMTYANFPVFGNISEWAYELSQKISDYGTGYMYVAMVAISVVLVGISYFMDRHNMFGFFYEEQASGRSGSASSPQQMGGEG